MTDTSDGPKASRYCLEVHLYGPDGPCPPLIMKGAAAPFTRSDPFTALHSVHRVIAAMTREMEDAVRAQLGLPSLQVEHARKDEIRARILTRRSTYPGTLEAGKDLDQEVDRVYLLALDQERRERDAREMRPADPPASPIRSLIRRVFRT